MLKKKVKNKNFCYYNNSKNFKILKNKKKLKKSDYNG